MVAPFCGCAFGGFLYDLLLFTGESPLNTPYLGLYRMVPGKWHMYDDRKFDPQDVKEKDGVV